MDATFYRKLHKWVMLLTGIVTLAGVLTLTHRFGIVQMPAGFLVEDIPAGSYLLIDRSFWRGRPLVPGDFILYTNPNSVLGVGKVVSLPQKAADKSENCYLIEIATGLQPGSYTLFREPAHKIRGRVLMVLFHPQAIPLPQEKSYKLWPYQEKR